MHKCVQSYCSLNQKMKTYIRYVLFHQSWMQSEVFFANGYLHTFVTHDTGDESIQAMQSALN